LNFQTSVQWFESTPGGAILRTGLSPTPQFRVGNNINIIYPCNYEWMNVTTQYSQTNEFRNRTYDSISVSFLFTALAFNINIPAIQIIPRICIPPNRICVNIPYPCPTWSRPWRWCTERVCVDPICVGPLATPAFNFGFGPLWTYNPQIGSIRIPYFDRTWQINGTTTNTSRKFILDARDYFVTVVGNDIPCHGEKIGIATATVTNGGAPYRFEWSDGTVVTQQSNVHTVSSLPGGTNFVMVFSRYDCIGFDEVYIEEPLRPLTIRLKTTTDVSCNGGNNGTASLTVEGGTPNYSYTWSPNVGNTANVTNLSAGKYFVTVTDANACEKIDSVEIKQPYALVATTRQMPISCFGGNDGAIDLEVVGGSEPYTYAWSNGATTKNISNVPGGNYTVTVTDRLNCVTTATQIVSQPPQAISISNPVVTNASCFGGSDGAITVTVTGGTAPYDHKWAFTNGQVAGNFTNAVTNIPADTYILTVTDANNCTATSTATVTQPAEIEITSVVTNVNCFGAATGAIDVRVIGGTPGYTYNWSNGAGTQDLNNVVADNYVLIVTDANNCEKQHQAVIAQPAAALAGFLTKKDVSCNGGIDGKLVTTANGGTIPYSYNWNNGKQTKDVDSLIAGNYAIEITDSKGCILNLNETIIEPLPLDISFVVQNVSCFGGSDGSIDATVTGGNAPYSLTWSNSLYIVLNHFNPLISNLKTDTYSLKVTDSKNCVHQEDAVVAQPQQPITVTYTKEDVKCFGANTGSIDITVVGGTAPYTYSWSNGANTQDVLNLIAGTYFVTTTDAQNCERVDSVIIMQPLQPLTIVDSIKPVSCFGGNDGTIEISVSGATPTYTYAWSNGATTTKLSNLTAGNYTVTVTDILNCELIEIKTVAEPIAPVAVVANVTDANCYKGSDGIIVLDVAGGTAGYTYHWATSTFIVINDYDSILSNVKAGNYLVTVTDTKGCSDSLNIAMGEPSEFKLDVVANNGVSCFGIADGNITVNAVGGNAPYNYVWDNGVTINSLDSLASGEYTITVTDAKNCELSITYTIDGPTEPLSAEVISTPVKCFDDENGTASLTVRGGTQPYQVTWTNGETGYALYNLAAGPYTITVFDNNGCLVKTGTYVNGPVKPLDIAFTTDSVKCFGGKDGSIAVTLEGGTTPYKYYWADTLNLFNNNRESINNLEAKDYLFRVVDYFGCDRSVIIPVYEPTPLSAIFNTSNIKCYGNSDGAIKVLASGGVPPYDFRWNDTVTGGTLTAIEAGNYAVTITDFNNCKLVADTTLYQPKRLSVNLYPKSVSCMELQDAYIETGVGGGTPEYTFKWNTGQTTQNISGLEAGFYSLTVRDQNNCTDSASAEINPSETDCIYIPNSFTPNGDGKNDTWMIKNIGLRPNCVVIIFNKWGNKLFESKGYNEPWDGTMNGSPLPADTYYFIIDLGTGKPPINGPVTIVR
jgi:gliding motility-associated-like protein